VNDGYPSPRLAFDQPFKIVGDLALLIACKAGPRRPRFRTSEKRLAMVMDLMTSAPHERRSMAALWTSRAH
jgi:hypothetical protein